MSSRNFSVTEPHPSVPKKGSAYIGGGRGGAGNIKKYHATDLTSGQDARGPPSKAPLQRPTPQRAMTAGRGGAGNLFKPSTKDEGQIFKFDEELIRERENQAPVYMIGRGGAANFVNERQPQRLNRLGSTDSSSTSSAGSMSSGSSSGSMRSAWNKMTRRVSRD
ncbi:hypothetical protein MBLNU230_g4042t1 [Neophaeotheca triangularis]